MVLSDSPNGRRRVLAAGAALLGAIGGLAGSRNTAEAHGTVHYDSHSLDPAVHGNNDAGTPDEGGGPGVLGTSLNGAGVRGESVVANGVRGQSDQGNGVRGTHLSMSSDAAAVVGVNTGLGTGVIGRATNGNSVTGLREAGMPGTFHAVVGVNQANGHGVVGTAVNGAGVSGSSTNGDGVIGVVPPGSVASFASGVNGVNNAAGPAISAQRTPTATGSFGAIEAFNLAEGPGIHGVGKKGDGVVGERPPDATGSFAAVYGTNQASGVGVLGNSKDNAGVFGASSNGAGVIGVSSNGEGVRGDRGPGAAGTFAAVTGENRASGPGVVGLANAPQGEGVVGFVGDVSGIGVHARNDYGGIALAVNSKARFKVCGKAAIPQNGSSTVVTAPVSPVTSLVLVTLLGDPGQAALWVEIGSGSFTVHLGGGGGGGGAHSTIPFTWFAIEQAP